MAKKRRKLWKIIMSAGDVFEMIMLWPAVRERLKDLADNDPVIKEFWDNAEDIYERFK